MSDTANPWDVKLVSSLTETEMIRYLKHLECDGSLQRYKLIEEGIERAVERWRYLRETGDAPTATFGFHDDLKYISLGSYWSSGDVMDMREYRVKVYAWMEEEHVRVTAREQLMEQVFDNND